MLDGLARYRKMYGSRVISISTLQGVRYTLQQHDKHCLSKIADFVPGYTHRVLVSQEQAFICLNFRIQQIVLGPTEGGHMFAHFSPIVIGPLD